MTRSQNFSIERGWQSDQSQLQKIRLREIESMPLRSSNSNKNIHKGFRMTERVGLKEESQILIPAVAARMNNNPYPE